MRHAFLFLYFLLLSSGFAGITVTLLLMKRLHSPRLKWVVSVMGVFTLWLTISLVLYYIESIIVYPLPATRIMGSVNILLGIAVYTGLFICVRKVYTGGALLPQAASALPLLLFYGYLLTGAVLIPELLRFSPLQESLFRGVSILSAAIFLAYGGYAFIRGAKKQKQETEQFFFRWMGRITLLFAPISVVFGIIGIITGTEILPTVVLNYIYFFSWNVIGVITFIRYMVKPSALIQQDGLSEGFTKEFTISKREAEIIDLISHGFSNKEIAGELNISFTTVRTHVYNIFRKTAVTSRVELLRLVSGYRE